MNMKKEVLLLIFIISVVSVMAVEQELPENWLNSTAQIGDYPQIEVTYVNYEPFPVEPGEYFDVWLRVKNLGNKEADGVEVEISNKAPFSAQDNRKVIGKLGSLKEALIKFENVLVSEDAPEGDNILEVLSTAGGGYINEYKVNELNIRVQSASPILDISIESEPEMIPQGGQASINLNLKNTAKSLLKDITVILNLPDELVSVNSVAEKKIDKIKAGFSKSVDFSILAMANADAKAYKVGVNVTYYDEAGTKYSKDNYIGLLVGSEPEFAIYVGDNEILQRGQAGNIMFDVYNIGPSDIKFVNLELIPTKDYDVISNPKLYLGNIDSDDYESGEYKVYTNGCFACKDEIEFKLSLEYRDSYNNPQEEIIYVPLKLYSGKEIKLFGLKKVSGSWNGIIYLLIIIFIYLAYKGFRKEKDLPKALKYAALRMLTYLMNFLRKLRWRHIKRLPRKIKLFLNSLR